MVKRKSPVKRRSTRRAAPRAAPRRRTNASGTKYIPSAAATVGLVYANKDNIKGVANAITNNGNAKTIPTMVDRALHSGWVMQQYQRFLTLDNLVKSGVALAGGYVAGEVVKKYAPAVIKRPLGKLAKKMPKVI